MSVRMDFSIVYVSPTPAVLVQAISTRFRTITMYVSPIPAVSVEAIRMHFSTVFVSPTPEAASLSDDVMITVNVYCRVRAA